MSDTPKILVFAGSARDASFNKKLAKLCAGLLEEEGAAVTFVDLKDYPIPLYDGDLEAGEGLPEHARTLKRAFAEHDGFMIAAPEYNGSLTPLIKNTIDWLTRPGPDDDDLRPVYRGKTAALCSTSPGALGGLRGLIPLRLLLSGIGVHVVPDQLAIGGAMQAFTDDGALADDAMAGRLRDLARSLIATTRALNI